MKTEAEKRSLIINALLYAGELQPVDFDALVGDDSPLLTLFSMAHGLRVTWYEEGYCKILAALIEEGTVAARYDDEEGWFYSLTQRQPRYKVVKGSVSCHCCFEATVVDTQTLDSCGEASTVAECFELKHAQHICDALNSFATK